jgi:oligopeptide transport system substrate-binding protein
MERSILANQNKEEVTMKKVLSFVLAALMALSLSALAPALADAAPAAKEIVWARGYDASSLDPAEASDDASISIVSYIGEGLTRLVNGEVVPGVAESWDVSDDGLTYTFHLRTSTWSDGTPLTAGDFEYSFLRLVDPNAGHSQANAGYVFANAQDYAEGKADVSTVGVKAVDDSTLQLTFKETSLENLYTLATTQFLPVKKDLADQEATAYGSEKDKIIGNGPFTLTEWSHDAQIVLEKNPNYWNADDVKLTKITALAGVAEDAAVEMMQTGQVDVYSFKTPQNYQQLADSFSDFAYSDSDTFLHINNTGSSPEAGKFLSNVNFRLALSYALDRTALCNSVLPGQTPATRLAQPDMAGVSGKFVDEYPLENGINVAADAAKAKEYLDKALTELGATIDQVPELSMLCYESQTSQTVLQACQDMFLSTLGVKCKIDPQPIQQMISKVYSHDFDFWYGGIPAGSLDVASTNGVLPYWDSSNPDALFGYNNPKFDEYVKTAQTSLDMKARKDAVFEAEKIFCAEVPDLLITWQTVHCMYKPSIVLNGTNPAFGEDLAFADIK